MHSIRIDRDKRLAAEPHCGHNRYHPDIEPVAEIGEGEEIALETRDALDGQIKPGMTAADLAAVEAGVVHPLTGPVFVKGAMPGDMLEIEFTDIIAQPIAFSAIMPGLGFLRDVFADPFLVHWEIRGGWPPRPRSPACAFRARRSWAFRRWRRRRTSCANGRPASSGSSMPAGSLCRPIRRARCRPGPAASPACARRRPARTGAISLSNRRPKERSRSCRYSRQAGSA